MSCPRCNSENSVGAVSSQKRICLDCGKHWIKNEETLFDVVKDYFNSLNPETTTGSAQWFQDRIEEEQRIRKLQEGLGNEFSGEN